MNLENPDRLYSRAIFSHHTGEPAHWSQEEQEEMAYMLMMLDQDCQRLTKELSKARKDHCASVEAHRLYEREHNERSTQTLLLSIARMVGESKSSEQRTQAV